MKSVNFWLPPNLIKHVDEAFRGTAGSQEKRDLGSGDQGTESVGARDLWRGDGWGHCDVSSVCACVCVSSTNGEQCSWDFFHLVTVCQVILQEAGRCSGLFCRSVSGHMITWFLPAAKGKLLLLICLMNMNDVCDKVSLADWGLLVLQRSDYYGLYRWELHVSPFSAIAK